MKKCSKKILILLSITFSLFFITNKVSASTATLSMVGEQQFIKETTFTQDIMITEIEGTLTEVVGNIEISDSSCFSLIDIVPVDSFSHTTEKQFTYLNTDGINANTIVARATFKAGSNTCEATLNIQSASAIFTDSTIEPITISKKLFVIEPIIQKSNDATLKKLVPNKGELLPGFSSDTTYYEIKLKEELEEINFETETNHEKAQIKSGNTCIIQDKETQCEIIVQAEDETTKTYTIKVIKEVETNNETPTDTPNENPNPEKPAENKPEEKKSSDATLKSLTISGYSLTPKFNKEQTEYNISIPNGVNELKIEAILNDAKAKINIDGNSNLKEGENKITIEILAEDGTKKMYNINVTKKSLESPVNKIENTEKGNNLLEDLQIEGYTLKPTFDPNKNEYEVHVGNVDKIDIKAIAKNKNAKIEIIGNKGLKEGRNLVYIKVKDENNFTKTYFIYVTKEESKKGFTMLEWFMILGGLLVTTILIYIAFFHKKKKDKKTEPPKTIPKKEEKPEFNFSYTEENELETKEKEKEITKDELFNALEEARKTKDPTKLKEIYEQELRNRKKQEEPIEVLDENIL